MINFEISLELLLFRIISLEKKPAKKNRPIRFLKDSKNGRIKDGSMSPLNLKVSRWSCSLKKKCKNPPTQKKRRDLKIA
jgi:hypothetical protein